jgi:hypothetical protein
MDPVITDPAVAPAQHAPPAAPAGLSPSSAASEQPLSQAVPLPPRRDGDLPEPCQETDVLWGSYAGGTLFPSLIVGVLLTGFVGWVTWRLLPRDQVRLTFIALAGSVWLVIAIRWGYRFFAYTFRLTTHRLLLSKGFLYGRRGHEVDLGTVAHVQIKRNGWERFLGTGRICLVLDDKDEPPLVLEGVKEPLLVAELFRETCKKAREMKISGVRV